MCRSGTAGRQRHPSGVSAVRHRDPTHPDSPGWMGHPATNQRADEGVGPTVVPMPSSAHLTKRAEPNTPMQSRSAQNPFWAASLGESLLQL
jgi:hypothetical protein